MCATPMLMGQWPAAALMYRCGYIQQGEPVVYEQRSLADLRPPVSQERLHAMSGPHGPRQRASEHGLGAAAWQRPCVHHRFWRQSRRVGQPAVRATRGAGHVLGRRPHAKLTLPSVRLGSGDGQSQFGGLALPSARRCVGPKRRLRNGLGSRPRRIHLGTPRPCLSGSCGRDSRAARRGFDPTLDWIECHAQPVCVNQPPPFWVLTWLWDGLFPRIG